MIQIDCEIETMADQDDYREHSDTNLALALHRVSLELHRAARLSEKQVYLALSRLLSESGYFGAVCLLVEPTGTMQVHEFIIPVFYRSAIQSLIRWITEGILLDWESDPVYSQVIASGRPAFVGNSSDQLRMLLPDRLKPSAALAALLIAGQPGMLLPLSRAGVVYAVLALSAGHLRSQDLPAWQAFADQLHEALETARWIAQSAQASGGLSPDRQAAAPLLQDQSALIAQPLNSSQRGMQALIEAIPDAVTLKDGEGRWLYVNPIASQLFRLDGVPWQGKTDGQLMEMLPGSRKLLEICHHSDQIAWESGRQYDFVEKMHGPDGEEQVYDVHKVPVFDASGGRLGLVVIGRDITDYMRMEQSLRSRAEELAELHALSVDVISEHNISAILDRVVERAIRLLRSKSGSLYLCDHNRQVVKLVVELPTVPADHLGIELKFGEGAAGRVAVSNEPLIVDDYRHWQHRSLVYERDRHYSAVLSVPLAWQGRVIGVLQVMDHAEKRTFNHRDQELLSLFANQAAGAIENTRLLALERSQLLLARTLQQVSALHTTDSSLDNLLEKILDLLGKVVQFDSVSIQLLDSRGKLTLAAGRGFADLAKVRRIVEELSDSAMLADWLKQEAVVIADTHQDSRWVVFPDTENIRSWIGAPLLVKGHFIGSLNVDANHVDAFDQDAAEMVMAFANQAAIAIENARLFEAAGKRAAELEALRRASLSLTSSLDLVDVLDAILKSVLALLPGMRNAHIFLYSEGKERLTFGAALDADGKRGEMLAEPRPHGLTYTVARSGDLIRVSDMKSSELYRGAPAEWHGAIIGLPLKIGPRVVGVMNISYDQPRDFPESEMHLLRLLADQAAIAIENASLFEQAATERRHLRLLYDVAQSVSASLDPETILDRAVELTCNVFGGVVAQGFIFSPEEQSLRMCAIHGRSDVSLRLLEKKLTIALDVGLAGWAARNQQAVYVDDVSQDERWFYIEEVDRDIRSALTVPILLDDRLLGVISVLHRQFGAFNQGHVELMIAVCQEIGLALLNADRYQQSQRRLMEISLIQQLAQKFNQQLELQELLDEVVTRLAETFSYPQVRISLIEDDFLALKACHGPRPYLQRIRLDEGVSGLAARSGELVYVPDVSQDSEFVLCVPGTVAAMAVPIFLGNSVIGVINIETDAPMKLDNQDRNLFKLLADQISIAIENAVLYQRIRQHAQELEQTVARRTEELRELYELSQAISSTSSYEELLRLLLEHLLGAMHGCLVMGSLRVETGWISYLFPAVRLTDSELARVQAYWSGCLQRLPGGAPLPGPEDLVIVHPTGKISETTVSRPVSFVCTYIGASENPAGILVVAGGETWTANAEQQRLLDTFALQAAAAVQRISAVRAEQHRRLQGLVEHLPVGVCLLDQELRLLLANPLGRHYLQLINGKDHPQIIDRLGSIDVHRLVSRKDDHLPVEIALPGQARLYFEAQVRSMKPASDQWIVTLRDVSQEREAQVRIQMQERLATVGQLAAGIAHDFNNIMAAILVYADLLLHDKNLEEASRERVDIIQQQVQRAASLIRQILDFSRRAVMEQSALDLAPFIKELEKMLGRVIPETIRLRLKCAPGDYWVNADPGRLQQVFINLALNSRDAMPDGGTLGFYVDTFEVQAKDLPPLPDLQPGWWVRVAVSDTGVGIPENVLPHIFEPFYTTKPVGQGTGLGLAQVYGIIKQHGGHIEVRSAAGAGTTFTIYLPKLIHAQTASGRVETPPPQDGSGKRVLLVEDDPATLEALQTLLEVHNYQVVVAENGSQALQILQQDPMKFDLLVSDIVMPEMGGLALFQNLRTTRSEIKALFVTGHPLDAASQDLLEKGDVDWLQKPFSVREFIATIERLIEG
jgi:PAS domain S-box-containing protein